MSAARLNVMYCVNLLLANQNSEERFSVKEKKSPVGQSLSLFHGQTCGSFTPKGEIRNFDI